MVADDVQLDRLDEATDLFLAHFHGAAGGGVGVLVSAAGFDRVALAEDEAGGLRAADAFAAGEDDQVTAALGELA